ncbi:hypothetical protein Tco_0025207 [Tanacetum coccineum]
MLCPCCDNYIETVEHCIISCEDAMRVWEMIFTWWGMGSVNIFTVRDLFNHKGDLVVDKVSRKVWNAVLRDAGYLIWKRRNDRVFRGTCGNIVRLFQEIQLKSYEWINRRFAPQLHESAGGLPKTKFVSHLCSLAGSTSAMEVSIPIAFVLPGREHECNESFKKNLGMGHLALS